MNFTNVTIFGAGTMGHSIALLFATGGHDVILSDTREAALDEAKRRIAKTAQDSIRPIRNCFKFGNPNTVTKTAARIAGNPVGPCRRPFCSLSDAAVEKIRETVAADHARGMK